jgi:hypothetical protein
LTPATNGILYATPTAPEGLNVAPGKSVNLADCTTSTCTVIPGATGQQPSVTFDSVDLQPGSPTGVTVYQMPGLIDYRYAPVDCFMLLYVPPIGTAPFDKNEYTEVIRLFFRKSGIPIRESGRTRFDEPIVDGVISRDDKGQPIRDGSIDELLAANEIFVDGKKASGPAAGPVIVVETPAFVGSRFDLRVAA